MNHTNTVQIITRIVDFTEQRSRVITIIVFGCFIIWGVTGLVEVHKIGKRYGFNYTTPELARRCEVFMLRNVKPGSIFAKAGFQSRDIVVPRAFPKGNTVHKYLDQESGTSLWLEVIRLEEFDCEEYLNYTNPTLKIEFVAP